MKNKLAIILFTTLGALLFAIGPVRAQVAADTEVRANVPFQFYAGNTQFPAGNYRIALLDPMDPNELMITTTDGKVSALVEVDQTAKPASGATVSKTTDLTFDKYGTRYFLSGITVQGAPNATMLQKSRLEQLVSRGEVPGQGRHITGTKTKRTT